MLGGEATPKEKKRTPFGSLQLAADVRSDRDEVSPRVMSYLDATPGQSDINLARKPLFAETQPLNTFKRIFGGTVANPADTTKLLAQKKSVLDFMRKDLARLSRLVPASERVRLDAQATAIQQLESSIQAALVTGVCKKPNEPMSFTPSGTGASGGLGPAGGSKLSGVDWYDPKDPNHHPHQELGRLQLSMIQAAFTCDLVRVATFMWSAGTNWVVFPGTFQGATINGAPQPHHPPSHTTDNGTLSWLEQIDTFYARQTSEALQAFDAVVDVDGKTLLDNTVVAYVTEVARAYDHNQTNVPFLVFGGANTRIRGGQFIRVTDGSLPSADSRAGNRPTNDVWLALAPIFGVDLPKLGADNQWKGALPGLIA